MRDERGTTIKAKNLHHSTVLTPPARRSSPPEIVDGKETPSFRGNVKELAF
jgi:hypothetical protein